MIQYTPEHLAKILAEHRKWRMDEGGKRAYLSRADLSGASLRGAYLRGADLSRADLRGAYLRGADLRGASLRGADFSGASLRGAYLRGADLRGASLSDADLSGASLRGASLSGADFSRASLSGADLRGADFSRADLAGADLTGADLVGKKISTVIARATRSDNYEFIAFATDAGIIIRAGCRTFSPAEYREHIAAQYPRTDKATETTDILDFIELRASRAAIRTGEGEL